MAQLSPSSQSETDLKNRVMRYLKTFGGMWIKNWGCPHRISGEADITGCYNGLFIAIELKRPGAYKQPVDGLSPAQRLYSDEVQRAGGIYLITDDLRAVQRLLEGLRGTVEGDKWSRRSYGTSSAPI